VPDCQDQGLPGYRKCRVEEKVAWLMNEAGIDGAFNYKETGDLVAEVANTVPRGLTFT
jgi:NADPH-dependent curcumin reductase CurA